MPHWMTDKAPKVVLSNPPNNVLNSIFALNLAGRGKVFYYDWLPEIPMLSVGQRVKFVPPIYDWDETGDKYIFRQALAQEGVITACSAEMLQSDGQVSIPLSYNVYCKAMNYHFLAVPAEDISPIYDVISSDTRSRLFISNIASGYSLDENEDDDDYDLGQPT